MSIPEPLSTEEWGLICTTEEDQEEKARSAQDDLDEALSRELEKGGSFVFGATIRSGGLGSTCFHKSGGT